MCTHCCCCHYERTARGGNKEKRKKDTGLCVSDVVVYYRWPLSDHFFRLLCCVVFLPWSALGKNDVCVYALAEIKKRKENPEMSRAPECHPNDCRNDSPFSQHFVPAAFIRTESNCNCSRLLLLLLYFTSNNSRCRRRRRGFTISLTLISPPNYHLAFSSGEGGTGSPSP